MKYHKQITTLSATPENGSLRIISFIVNIEQSIFTIQHLRDRKNNYHLSLKKEKACLSYATISARTQDVQSSGT
jgi:hypothetical protein